MVVQRSLTPPVGVRSSHPQPQPQQANLLRFYYRGVAQMVARLVWDQDAAGSSPVAPTIFDAGVAQLVEQLICNQQVGGSNPSTSSTISYGGVPEWPKGADCKSVA